MSAKYEVTGNGLKILAIITMVIDHIGAGLIEVWLKMNWDSYPNQDFPYLLYHVDLVLRYIGRIAFPLYCYLLVEGFFHTKNIRKYAVRLLTIAIISEVPFDYLIANKFFYPEYNNVLWELLLGLITLYAYSYINNKVYNIGIRYALWFVVLVTAIALAHYAELDYHEAGICCISVMYFSYGPSRANRLSSLATGILMLILLSSSMEIVALVTLIPMYFYQGRRGVNNRVIKTMFYLVYPVHIIVLGMIAYFFLR